MSLWLYPEATGAQLSTAISSPICLEWSPNSPIQAIEPYTAWNWPRYFTYAQETALEEHFEKDQYQWRIKYGEIASQIRADVDMVKARDPRTRKIGPSV